ncbi:MAG: PLP-dependent aminotransferase family protein [Oscillospiraceae bacterium]|nr:PLP-dependent aminotransferase family protein [Oscillospiraceae bacterium]
MVSFAERMNDVKASDIRELLALVNKPEIISFAGGLPAPELFPVDKIQAATDAVLQENGRAALQYGPTDGILRLREQICDRIYAKNAIKADPSNIIITAGSQQGLDFVARLFVNPGDAVLMESPSYLGAINAFKLSQPVFGEVPTDDGGMIMEELDKMLASTPNVKMIYVIPDFQNPSGRTWSLERRKKFMEIVNKYEVMVIEDNPYGELRYKGEYLPSLKSMDTKGLVIYLGTFSKILAPGYRLAWICASHAVIEKINLIAQAAVLQSSTISMMVVAKFIDMFDLDEHVETVRAVYEHRCNVMMDAMGKYFPKEVKYTIPDGGLFTWAELPDYIDTKVMATDALAQNVAYVPGIGFFPNGNNHHCMRLNYSCMPDERIEEGIRRLADVIKNNLR